MPPARKHAVPSIRWAVTFVVTTLLWPCVAHAQSGQEKIIQQRLERAGTLEFEPAAKAFSTGAAGGNRQASVRSFAFGARTANPKGGDGSFRAKSFNDSRGNFSTGKFAVRSATAVDRQAMPQADRTFATRAVDVREDRATGKQANVRQYATADKPFLVPGKRQDSIDELRQQKNLSIEQIREILNKNR